MYLTIAHLDFISPTSKSKILRKWDTLFLSFDGHDFFGSCESDSVEEQRFKYDSRAEPGTSASITVNHKFQIQL